MAALALGGPAAAEVLQVRGSQLLQVGDGNRSYTGPWPASRIDPEREAAASRLAAGGTAAPHPRQPAADGHG